ncbi:N-acetylneuraminate synthase family protein [Desulfosediminicola flagellatus]|uniref:N-acetylneuraminate synthase family protein n=1 Tax=Desulfosediminicola flagellatus TaxID=2569541 RepID=UPI0010ABEE25|nr:N-acetylneuraminate synthase family protein [Desulfosediminicola flagellatus]
MTKTRSLKIGEHLINDDSDCYVIAEIGNNHQGSVDVCKEMFVAAKKAGADAVKLQKRDNKTLYTSEAYNKPYENRNSFGATYGEHREFLEFGFQEYIELKKFADEQKIDFFATAFDIPSANFLKEVGVPAYKIASGDLKTIPLLKHIAGFGKPILMSTGGGTLEDIKRAYDAIMPINNQLCIMQCTGGYPPAWDELNLRVISTLQKNFPGIVTGFSSHDSGIAMAIAGYMLGARVVEKHFTLNRATKGTDHAFSLEPVGLTKMVRDLRRLKVALGDGNKAMFPSEEAPITKMGKSLVANSDLQAGHVLTREDIGMKSPGGGIPPYDFENVIGKELIENVIEDQQFSISGFK